MSLECTCPPTAMQLLAVSRLGAGDLDRGQVRSTPSSAQGFDERDAGRHTPAQDNDGCALVGQSNALRGDHFEVRHHAAFISVVGQVKRVLCRRHGSLLSFGFVLENTQSGQTVFDLFEGSEDSLTIVCDRLVVGCPSLFVDGAAAAYVKSGNHGRCAGSSKTAWTGEPTGE